MIQNSFLAPKTSIFSAKVHIKKEIVTQEEKEKFQKEISQAMSTVVFPDNPQLFPQSIRIQQQNQKKDAFEAQLEAER